jgi:hypothetical protein
MASALTFSIGETKTKIVGCKINVKKYSTGS